MRSAFDSPIDPAASAREGGVALQSTLAPSHSLRTQRPRPTLSADPPNDTSGTGSRACAIVAGLRDAKPDVAAHRPR